MRGYADFLEEHDGCKKSHIIEGISNRFIFSAEIDSKKKNISSNSHID